MNTAALIAISHRIETALSFVNVDASPADVRHARHELVASLRDLEKLRRQEPGQDRRAARREPARLVVNDRGAIEDAQILPLPEPDDDVRRFIAEHQLSDDSRAPKPRVLCVNLAARAGF